MRGVSPSPGRRWQPGWPPQLGVALALVMLAAAVRPGAAPALAQTSPGDEVAAYLPSGATLVQEASGDTDGDGLSDTVALYTLPISYSASARVGVLVLGGSAWARTASHLFGPSLDTAGGPMLAPGDRAELTVRDANGDGLAEVLVGTVRVQRRDEQGLWVFRWDGTTYRLEALLEGQRVDVLDENAEGGAGLRVRDERRLPGLDDGGQTIDVDEVYRWRSDGYRLGERSLRFTGDLPAPTRPESAVLLFYQAIDRGDFRAAYDLFAPEVQAVASPEGLAADHASVGSIRVEEVRASGAGWGRQPDADLAPVRGSAVAEVYARVTLIDRAEGGTRGRSLVGLWRVRRVDDGWRLEDGRLGAAPSLPEIAEALPGGARVLRTAQGDLRGEGRDDLAVIAAAPGRTPSAEPYVLFRTERGLQAARLADLLAEESVGSYGGDLTIADVNGDGRPELVYGAVVGAHSSILWISAWDGARRGLVSRFSGSSNTAGLGLEDLDGDGMAEVVMPQSGYCGSYATSPRLTFVLRWQDGGYRPASADFSTLQGGFFERARTALAEAEGPGGDDARTRACIEHMLATAYALQGRAEEARAAYERHRAARLSPAPSGAPSGVAGLPAYVGSASFQAEARDLLERAQSGRLGTWGPSQLDALRDMVGDTVEARAL